MAQLSQATAGGTEEETKKERIKRRRIQEKMETILKVKNEENGRIKAQHVMRGRC